MATNNYTHASGKMMGDLISIDNGGTHNTNPNRGVPIGPTAKVEEGETINKNYVYSNKLYVDDRVIKKLGLPKNMKGKSFADVSKYIDSKYKRENDYYEDEAKQQQLDKLKSFHEEARMAYMNDNDTPISDGREEMLAGGAIALMAAPVVMEGINLARTASNKPTPTDPTKYNTDFQFDPNLVDRSQIKRDIITGEQTAANELRDVSGGNVAQYLANRVNLNTQSNTALAQANMQSDAFDAQEMARIQGLNYGQVMSNKQKEMTIDNQNAADIARWESQIQDSIANMGQGLGNIGMSAARANLAGSDFFSMENSEMNSGIGNSTNNIFNETSNTEQEFNITSPSGKLQKVKKVGNEYYLASNDDPDNPNWVRLQGDTLNYILNQI